MPTLRASRRRCCTCYAEHDGDSSLCENCQRQYFSCVNCGRIGAITETLYQNEDGQRICQNCEYDSLIGSCSTRPTFHPLGDAPFLGVELEVESTSSQYLRVARKIKEIFPRDFLVLKTDGSLSDYGFEICTRPASLAIQKQTWQPFFDAITARQIGRLTSFDAQSCGLHVHVSRQGLTQHAIALIVCFANLPKNKRFIETIANRHANTYCQFKAKRMISAASRTGDKYEAVNLEHQNSLEFRIFKGTLKQPSFFKALEFVHCLRQFCSTLYNTRKALSLNEFIKFAREREAAYPYLNAYISNRWYGKTSHLFNVQHWTLFNNAKPPLPPAAMTTEGGF